MRGALLASLACLCVAVGAAPAQYIEYDAQQRSHPLPGALPSIRLEGMGGLGLTVEDENNEINLSDFAHNLAGIVSDREGWTVESWAGRSLDQGSFLGPVSGTSVIRDESYDQSFAGTDVVYRKPGRRAIGGTADWSAHSTRLTLGPATKVRGPDVSGFYNEVLGRLTCGIGFTSWSDNEDVTSSDVFAIRHYSKTATSSFAAAYALRGWQAAGQVSLDRVTIHGVSADPAGFHNDEYTWDRPATRLRLSLIRPEGGKVAAGVNFSLLRRTGTEEATISWSDRFPSNPSRVNTLLHIPTFDEKENGWGVDARCLLKAGGGLELGGYGRAGGGSTVVNETPNANFIGSRQAQDIDLGDWSFGTGAGWTGVGERLRIGVEGYVAGAKQTSHLPDGDQIVKSRSLELRTGVEWLLPSRMAVRAGYIGGTSDENRSVIGNLYTANGVTLGLGYLPRGGLVSLDAALRLGRTRPDYTGGQQKRVDLQDFAFSARFLF